MEYSVYYGTHQSVTAIVQRTFILFEVCCRQSVADNHICLFLEYHTRHLPGILHRIGVVAIDEDIAVSINLA